jgi:hypothetical protein
MRGVPEAISARIRHSLKLGGDHYSKYRASLLIHQLIGGLICVMIDPDQDYRPHLIWKLKSTNRPQNLNP